MSCNININPKVTDSYYRYKMPKVLAKIEGRGNGIKTLVVNLIDVSKALKRPVMYTLKYIGCELGAQTNADNKSERYIVNGAHESDKIQDVLYGFIEKFVLCPDCENPETALSVIPKKEKITISCKACGNCNVLATNHKVVTFILKNPPKVDKPKKTAVAKPKKNASAKTNEIEPTDQELAWSVDVSEEAIKKREEELSSQILSLIASNDISRPLHERLDLLEKYMKSKFKNANDLITFNDDIKKKSQSLELEGKFIFAVCSFLFDQNIVDQLQRHHKILLSFTIDDARVQKYLLGWIERLIDEHVSLMSSVPVIFKILFEADIVQEEVFLDWDLKTKSRFVSSESFQKIKEAAKKFTNWLKEDDENSADDESADENSDDRKPLGSSVQTTESLEVNNPVSDEDEIDIDNI